MTGWDRACGRGLGGAHTGLAEDRPASVPGVEEVELAALAPRCLLSLGANALVVGRSGVRASEEWLEGPYCMGEGAGGAMGDGLHSAAFICCNARAVVFPPNDVDYSAP